MNKAQQFLKVHKLNSSEIDIQKITDDFIADMKHGLEGKPGSLQMIPTYLGAEGKIKPNEPVVAIDAGGTNFRAVKMSFDNDMNLVTENLQQRKMPAIDEELSNKEFFATLAAYLTSYKDVSEKIGFCFSYAVEMFPNKDGKLLEWSKEVKAPEVIGQMVGENLLEAMGTPGKHIVLMNDTVSTLLAGQAATAGRKFDTYIGFILGTGTNACYIEKNKNISKTANLDPKGNMIINIESGNFSMMPRTDIDIAFDNTTKQPGRYTFEKMISGGYFGGLCTTTLKMAAAEEVFSSETKVKMKNMDELTSEEVNNFVSGVDLPANTLTTVLMSKQDKEAAAEIINAMITRSAKLTAASLAAVILKTGKGKSADKPVLMTIEGTTFYKMKNFQLMFEAFLQGFFSGENRRFYEIVEVPNSSLIGAGIAAIVN
ncbi:hexokinase family protein [Mariniphaga sp.]|uniref:hexokinase family protein n=1 Tax=Mariniphaga sp. TaxID=1954475 RepID=UPI0035627A92